MTASEIKLLKKLHQKKYRKEVGKFFVEGKKLCDEAIHNSPELIDIIYFTEEGYLAPDNLKSEKISSKEMERITALKNPSPFLVVLKMKVVKDNLKGNCLLLESLKDPGNMGTIIRSADWFGIEKIYLTPECVDVYNPKVIQATMGSFFRVQFQEISLNELGHIKKPLVGASLKGMNIQSSYLPKEYCLVIGNESKGISDEMSDKIDLEIKIPGKGKAESLNASVATGIMLFNLTFPNN